MSINFGSGFGMMGGMSMMNNMNGSENVHHRLTQKYGCEDCFRDRPYYMSYAMPVMAQPPEAAKPSFFRQVCNRVFGG